MVRLCGVAIMLFMIGALVPLHVIAQPSVPATAGDTTDFRYHLWPSMCAMHGLRVERQSWRDQRVDTVYEAPWGNPRRRIAVDGTRACLRKFSVGTTDERDLLFLGEAYLAAEMDVQADSAFARLVALRAKAPIEERAWTLAQIVMLHVQAEPARLAGADRYMAQLEALGVPAASERMLARYARYLAARKADSVTMMGTELQAAMAAGKQQVGDTRRMRGLDQMAVRTGMADWYARRGLNDSSRLVIKNAIPELSPLRAYIDRSLQYTMRLYDLLGSKAIPIEGTYWYNRIDSTAYPTPGKPTLIVFSSHGCENYCYVGYSVMRRLHQRFGSALNMVVSTRAEGYYRNKLFTPREEAEKTRYYFLDYLKLPAAVAMLEIKFTRRVDGARINDYPASIKSYFPAYTSESPAMALVDKDGVIRAAGGLTENSEARVGRMIEAMLRGTP